MGSIYKSSRPLPRNALPADYFAVQQAQGHLPLVFMLVLTQMSVGAFLVEQMMYSYFSLFLEDVAASVRPLHLGAALFLGLLGLAASVFHLGRPLYAFRALLGLRTSWLSREILAFGVFAAASTAYVGCALLDFFGLSISQGWQAGLGMGASATGLSAVCCSIDRGQRSRHQPRRIAGNQHPQKRRPLPTRIHLLSSRPFQKRDCQWCTSHCRWLRCRGSTFPMTWR